jgi:CheY-like chemotaxis protein
MNILKKHILMIETNEPTHVVLSKLLQLSLCNYGIEFEFASNKDDAIEKIQAGQYDCIIIDNEVYENNFSLKVGLFGNEIAEFARKKTKNIIAFAGKPWNLKSDLFAAVFNRMDYSSFKDSLISFVV